MKAGVMKIARWYNNRDIRLEDVSIPVIGKGDLLVEVVSCGICGSDIAEWYRLPRAPLVPGHELGGRVVETGIGVKAFKPGDRVFIAPKVPCLVCRYCRDGHHPVCSGVPERLPGGFAQFITVPAALVERGTYLLPETMSYEQSTFIEPLACVVRAQRLAGLKEGQTLMVMGCGISGLLHVKLAARKKCRIIATDLNRKRLDFAEKSGADTAIDARFDASAGLHGKTADVVMLCTSALPAIEQAWKCLDKGGTLVFFAVPEPGKEVVIPINYLWTREITIRTSYYCSPEDIREAVNLIESGAIQVEDMITHRLPLVDIVEGFRLVEKGEESIKVIINPNGPEAG
jgi:L-iditol 2-dehydrogenase